MPIDADLKETTRKAAWLLTQHPWRIWFWADSLGLEGLLDASHITGDPQYAAYVHGLLKAWIPRMRYRGEFDYTAAGVALLRAYENTRDESLLDAARKHAAYLTGFRKLQNGAYLRYEDVTLELPPALPLEHPEYAQGIEAARRVSEGGPCVFVEDIHLNGPFFAKLFAVTGEDRFRQLALDNLLPVIELLFDERTHLFHHFWQEETETPNGVAWGRGNGLALLGMLYTLSHLPEEETACQRIRDVLRRQSGALASLQDSSGDWHTVIDDPDSYLETSIAAFVVEGWSFAVRRGWLAEDYRPKIEKAYNAMLSHVEPDGKLSGVSYETFPSMRREHYRKMPRNAVVPWGQGPLITAIRSHRQLSKHDGA